MCGDRSSPDPQVFTPSPGLLVFIRNHWPALLEATVNMLWGHQRVKCSWQGPMTREGRGQCGLSARAGSWKARVQDIESHGSGRSSTYIYINNFLFRLSCLIFRQSLPGRTRITHPSLLQMRELRASWSGAELGLHLGLGACWSREDSWPAAKEYVLGDWEPYHVHILLCSLARAEFSTGSVLQRPAKCHAFSQGQAFLLPWLCLKSPWI